MSEQPQPEEQGTDQTLHLAKLPKPVAEMTDEELDEFATQVVEALWGGRQQ